MCPKKHKTICLPVPCPRIPENRTEKESRAQRLISKWQQGAQRVIAYCHFQYKLGAGVGRGATEKWSWLSSDRRLRQSCGRRLRIFEKMWWKGHWEALHCVTSELKGDLLSDRLTLMLKKECLNCFKMLPEDRKSETHKHLHIGSNLTSHTTKTKSISLHILRHDSRYFSDSNLLSYGFIFHFQSTFKHLRLKRFFSRQNGIQEKISVTHWTFWTLWSLI